MIKMDTTYLSNRESKHILEKIITPHLPKIVAGGYNPKKSRINNIYFNVNEKLGIFCTYTFEECLEFIINNQEARFTDIVNCVVYQLNNYCLSKQTYLKYKSTVANLIRLSKQLKKTCISNEQIAITCCEIMTIILMSESEVKKQNKLILN